MKVSNRDCDQAQDHSSYILEPSPILVQFLVLKFLKNDDPAPFDISRTFVQVARRHCYVELLSVKLESEVNSYTSDLMDLSKCAAIRAEDFLLLGRRK